MKKAIISIIAVILAVTAFYIVNNSKNDTPLRFASWGSQSEVKIIEETISDYELKSGKKVEFLHIPQNYFQKIHLLFASSLEPDVIFFNNQNIDLYIESDLLEDLTPYFPNVEKEYFKSSIDCFKRNQKLYAIPRDISNLVLYVNKDILKEQGVPYKEKFNSVEELINTAKILTTKEHFGINYEYNPLFWIYYLNANGGGILEDDTHTLLINNKKSLEALNLYSDMANKYHIAPNKSQVGSMTTTQMFINGKIAMLLSGRWLMPKFKETLDFNWDIAEFPSSTENKVYVDSSGWAIAKKSKKKEEAIEFIKYLSSKEVSEKLAKDGLIVPARIDVANEYIKNSIPHEKIFITMLKNTKPTPVNKNYNRINDIIIEKTESVLSGEKRAEEVFDKKTQVKLESLL